MEGKPRAPVRPTLRARKATAPLDRRWLLIALGVFAASIGMLLAALAVYRLTGPHPTVTLLIRRLRGVLRWMIPRQRNPPKHWS